MDIIGGFSLKKVKEIGFNKIKEQYGIRIRYIDSDPVFIWHDSWDAFMNVAAAISRQLPKSFFFLLDDFIKEVKRAYPEFYPEIYSEKEESIFDVLLELGFEKEKEGYYVRDNITVSIQDGNIKVRRKFRKNVVGGVVYFGKMDLFGREFFKQLLKSVS